MMNRRSRLARLSEELQNLAKAPPWGIECYAPDDVYDSLTASIKGPEGSPYERGTFKLEIKISEKYPFEPPYIKFVTPIRHPNIDNAGRICLDMLKMPPYGSWLPTIPLDIILVSIQTLLAYPNPEDPLQKEIAHEYKHDYENFLKNAQSMTEKYAMDSRSSDL